MEINFILHLNNNVRLQGVRTNPDLEQPRLYQYSDECTSIMFCRATFYIFEISQNS